MTKAPRTTASGDHLAGGPAMREEGVLIMMSSP
jgi:hypothetical protein